MTLLIAQLTTNLNFDAANAAATMLRETLWPFCYFFCLLGFVECCANSRGDAERILMGIIGLAVIVVLAVNFPVWISQLQVAVKGMMDANAERTGNMFYQMLNANLTNTPSVFDVGNYILYGMVKVLQGIGKVGLMIVDLLQNASIIALTGISPILIGMLGTSWTRSAGVRFIMTSFIICLWSIGTALVNILLYSTGQYIFGAALGAGATAGLGVIGAGAAGGLAITTMAMPALLLAMTIAALVPIALFLAVPIVLHVTMLGANPITSALSAGAGIAATATGIAGATAARSIGTAANLTSRAPAAAGSSPTFGSNGSAPLAQPVSGATPPPPVTGGGSSPSSGYASEAFDAATAAAREAAQKATKART